MTQQEYNAKIQEIQAMWGNAASFGTHHKDGKMIQAFFQVYWDGRNRVLGRQRNPFTPEVSYEWDDDLELRLRGSFAGALIHS